MHINQYATFIFDCDGVILDSNKIKTNAFFKVAEPYGFSAAEALVDHHKKYGGHSRYRKFEYFLHDIVGVPVNQAELTKLLESYACEIRDGLLTCEINPGLAVLRTATAQSRWMVVSGGDQKELQEIFYRRNLSPNFEGGIFGSPDTKEVILEREIRNSNIIQPALFLGDSRYDHEAASRVGIDFVFVSDWTEFSDWRIYQQTTLFQSVPDLYSLLDQAK